MYSCRTKGAYYCGHCMGKACGRMYSCRMYSCHTKQKMLGDSSTVRLAFRQACQLVFFSSLTALLHLAVLAVGFPAGVAFVSKDGISDLSCLLCKPFSPVLWRASYPICYCFVCACMRQQSVALLNQIKRQCMTQPERSEPCKIRSGLTLSVYDLDLRSCKESAHDVQ